MAEVRCRHIKNVKTNYDQFYTLRYKADNANYMIQSYLTNALSVSNCLRCC